MDVPPLGHRHVSAHSTLVGAGSSNEAGGQARLANRRRGAAELGRTFRCDGGAIGVVGRCKCLRLQSPVPLQVPLTFQLA